MNKTGLISLMALATLFLHTRAQDIPGPGAVPAPVITHEDLTSVARPALVSGDLDVFLDGVLSEALVNNKLAGLSLTVVQNGEIIIVKGYGRANLNNDPTQPDASLFRIGSISKTFTWLALMQLEENGILHRDDPINIHLPPALRIPNDGFSEPVLIRHIMNHVAGFEEISLREMRYKGPRPAPLTDLYLRDIRPHRVHAAGKVTALSDYGAALAGAIIEQETGQKFEDYVEKNILSPLNMQQTTFREQNIGLSDGYGFVQGLTYTAGRWIPAPFEQMPHLAPAISGSSTANDMARYMIALLDQSGEFKAVLPTRTTAKPHQANDSPSAFTQAFTDGFMRYRFGALEGFGHEGVISGFTSNMVLVAEKNIGIFVTANSIQSALLVQNLPRLILERYFPDEALQKPAIIQTPLHLNDYVGTYLTTQRRYAGFEKFLAGLTSLTQIRLGDDNDLISYTNLETTKRWQPIANDLFIEKNGNDHLTFKRNDKGRVTQISLHSGVHSYVRISPFLTPVSVLGALALTMVTSIALLIHAIVGKEARRNDPRIIRWAYNMRTVTAGLWLLFGLSLFSTILGIFALGNMAGLVYPTPMLLITLVLGCATTIGVTCSAFLLWPIWRRASWDIDRRVLYSFVLILWFLCLAPLIWWGAIGWAI